MLARLLDCVTSLDNADNEPQRRHVPLTAFYFSKCVINVTIPHARNTRTRVMSRNYNCGKLKCAQTKQQQCGVIEGDTALWQVKYDFR